MKRLVGPTMTEAKVGGSFRWGESAGTFTRLDREGIAASWRLDAVDWPHGQAGAEIRLTPDGHATKVNLELSGVPGDCAEEVADWWATLWSGMQNHLEHRLRPRRFESVRRILER